VASPGDVTTDGHAVQPIGRDLTLIPYPRVGDDLLVLAHVNATTAAPVGVASDTPPIRGRGVRGATPMLVNLGPDSRSLRGGRAVVGRPRGPGGEKGLAWCAGASDSGRPGRRRMDWDPELDVTLSNGRLVLTFQIAAVAGAHEAWAILEPGTLRRVTLGRAAALAARQRVDRRIAARLAAGWVPVDGRPTGTPTPLPPDLVVQISSLLEALARARHALGAADPSGRLWAACHLFRCQAWRFGVGAPGARIARARRERRLGELAEQAGDRSAAILHYRAALASHAGVGLRRRLRQLEAHGPRGQAGPTRVRRRIACTPHADSTRLSPARERSWVSGHPARTNTRRHAMKGRVQIVGRLPVALSRRVRATAKQRKVTLNTFLIEALTHAVDSRRGAEPKEAR
jgi:hypothetical protein